MEKIALTVAGETIENPVSALRTDGISALEVILRLGVGLILLVAVLASLAFIIWGGFDWMTAAGNKESIKKARSKIVYAVIGLVIAFSAFFIMSILSQFFGVEFFKVPAASPRQDTCTPAGGRCVTKTSNCPLNWNVEEGLTCRPSSQKCCTGF